MENKKYLPLKIIHLIVIIAGIALYGFSLINYSSYINGSVTLRLIVDIVAFAFGLVYLIMSYKKNASIYYKAFMWLLVISQVVESASILSSYTPSMIDIFKNNVNLVLFTLIAGARDYGKNNSYLLALCLVVFNVYAVFDVASMISLADSNAMATLAMFDRIGQLLLAISASFMVCGKYLDKTSRGSK